MVIFFWLFLVDIIFFMVLLIFVLNVKGLVGLYCFGFKNDVIYLGFLIFCCYNNFVRYFFDNFGIYFLKDLINE